MKRYLPRFNALCPFVNAWSDREASALVSSVPFFLEAIAYLAEWDAWVASAVDERALGFDSDAVDLGHAKWATTTAITIIDKCAAVLARDEGLPRPRGKEAAFADLAKPKMTSRLASGTADWVSAVRRDPDYRVVKDARDPFVHRHMTRRVYLGSTRPDFRARDDMEWVKTEELVAKSAAVGTRHGESFIDGVVAGTLGIRL